MIIAAVSVALLGHMSGPAHAEPYMELGMTVHQRAKAEPEIRLDNPLGHIKVGYEIHRFRFFVRHQSSIPQREYGDGLTEFGAKVRLTLEDLP